MDSSILVTSIPFLSAFSPKSRHSKRARSISRARILDIGTTRPDKNQPWSALPKALTLSTSVVKQLDVIRLTAICTSVYKMKTEISSALSG